MRGDFARPFRNFSRLAFGALTAALVLGSGCGTRVVALRQFAVAASDGRLVDQTDDDGSLTGFGGATLSGTAWDPGYRHVRLSSTATNSAELDSSWTPYYSNLALYWKLNGSGAFAAGDTVPATVGPAGATTGGTGGAWVAAKLYQGFQNNNNDDLRTPALNLNGTDFTMAFWAKRSATGTTEVVMNQGSATTDGWLHIIFSSNQVRFAFFADDLDLPYVWDTSFHHFAFTYNFATMLQQTYVDGQLLGGRYASGTLANAGPLIVGGPGNTNLIDDFAIWTKELAPSDIRKIYSRQSAAYSGTITSRVMDALAPGMSWTTFAWVPTLPFYKELPDFSGSVQNETSADYTALVGSTGATGANDLMTGIAGLWHLDEAAPTAGANNDYSDRSGSGNPGEAVGGVTFGADGKFGNAAAVDGATGSISMGNNFNFPATAPFSASIWFRTTVGTGAPVLMGKYYFDGTYHQGWLAYVSGTGVYFGRQRDDVGANAGATNASILDGQWHHAAIVFNGTTTLVYIDGVAGAPTSNTVSLLSTPQPFELGNTAGGGNHFNGSLDEAAIWTRVLHANEVQQLYRRGSNRLKHQVRICTTSNCSDDPNGMNWKGPDGTNQTYFSELNNNTVPIDGSGYVKTGLPTMLFSAFTNPVGNSRYFQYRTVLESDDSGASCDYGSGPTWCSPELRSVSVGPGR